MYPLTFRAQRSKLNVHAKVLVRTFCFTVETLLLDDGDLLDMCVRNLQNKNNKYNERWNK